METKTKNTTKTSANAVAVARTVIANRARTVIALSVIAQTATAKTATAVSNQTKKRDSTNAAP